MGELLIWGILVILHEGRAVESYIGHSYSETIHVIAWFLFLSSVPMRVEQETGEE